MKSFWKGLTKPFKSFGSSSSNHNSNGYQEISPANDPWATELEFQTHPGLGEHYQSSRRPIHSSSNLHELHPSLTPERTSSRHAGLLSDFNPRAPPNTPGNGYDTPIPHYHSSSYPPVDGIDTPPAQYEEGNGFGNRITDPPDAGANYRAENWWVSDEPEPLQTSSTSGSDSGYNAAHWNQPQQAWSPLSDNHHTTNNAVVYSEPMNIEAPLPNHAAVPNANGWWSSEDADRWNPETEINAPNPWGYKRNIEAETPEVNQRIHNPGVCMIGFAAMAMIGLWCWTGKLSVRERRLKEEERRCKEQVVVAATDDKNAEEAAYRD